MNKLKILLASVLICCGFSSNAQHVSISSNVLDLALCSANLSAGVAVSRHFSLDLGAVHNPHSMVKESGLQVSNMHKTAYLGVRYWPWYVFSGWWVSAKAQYSEFSRTGVWRLALEEGKAVGGGFSAGYTLMLSKRLNLDLGAGLWAGQKMDYHMYHCVNCMNIREEGSKFFIAPDKVSISLMFVF